MKRVLERIEERKARFAALDLFRRFEGRGTASELAVFAHGLTFFAMAFQDIVRINATRVRDPALAAIAARHRDEDAGHERWFLHDLKELDAAVDVGTLFGPLHEVTRDTSYLLVAEALSLENDHARLGLVLALEATGDALFQRAPGFLERAGHRGRLLYFSKRHHEVESAHDLHADGLASILDATVLDAADLATVSATVERTFDAMETMVNALEARVAKAAADSGIRTPVARASTG